jgi:DNA-directed RNA polymerase specialized sigma24 family protein
MKIVGAEAPTAVTLGFAAFYADNRVAATRLVWLLTHDRGLCEDIVQEAFTAVYPRFDTVLQPTAYLRRTIVNLVAERGRRSGREQRRIKLVHAGLSLQTEGPTGGMLDAIGLLPINQRTAIVLRYWADLDHNQIAEAMDVRPGTVRSLLSRATDRLRKDITP